MKAKMFDAMQRGEDLPMFTGHCVQPVAHHQPPPAPVTWKQMPLATYRTTRPEFFYPVLEEYTRTLSGQRYTEQEGQPVALLYESARDDGKVLITLESYGATLYAWTWAEFLAPL